MKKIVTALLLLSVFALVSLGASTRAGVSGTLLNINAFGLPTGDRFGITRSSTLAPAVTLDAEISPALDFAIIIKADVAPFSPSIKAKGEILPSLENVVDKYTLAADLSFGAGWQMPISYWAYVDSPFEVTIGGIVSAGLIHINYDTPNEAFSGNEFIFSTGFYESVSFYFGAVGLTLSSVQSFAFADFSSWKTKATGGETVVGNAFIFTPVMFNWNASLGLSVRFGY